MSSYTLAGEDPALTAAIEKLRALARADGIQFDTAAYGGVRTEADTIKILGFRAKEYPLYVTALAVSHPERIPDPIEVWRPIAPFGSSMHNWGCARDIIILKKPDGFTEAEAFRRVGSHASDCGLKWGGTFQQRPDPPHFEVRMTLGEAKKRWQGR